MGKREESDGVILIKEWICKNCDCINDTGNPCQNCGDFKGHPTSCHRKGHAIMQRSNGTVYCETCLYDIAESQREISLRK